MHALRPRLSSVAGLVVAVVLAISPASLAWAQAQISEWISTETEGYRLTLELEEDVLFGELVAHDGYAVSLTGIIDDDLSDDVGFPSYTGFAFDDDDNGLAFEGFLGPQIFVLLLGGLDENDSLDYSDVFELEFVPADGGAAATPPQPAPQGPPTPAPSDPTPTPPATPAQRGGEHPLVGTFEGQGLTITIRRIVNSFTGTFALGGASYPFTGRATDAGLAGSFHADGNEYVFEADLDGDVLTLRTGGATYRTVRQGDPPATAPASPLAPATPQEPASEVIATSPSGDLRTHTAEAFLDLAIFAMRETGFDVDLDAEQRASIVEAIAADFPGLEPWQQAVVLSSRQILPFVQSNWRFHTEADQDMFVAGILVVTFGEETIRGYYANDPGNAGTCDSLASCVVTSFGLHTMNAAVAARGCWTAAGCVAYDPTTNTFTFRDP